MYFSHIRLMIAAPRGKEENAVQTVCYRHTLFFLIGISQWHYIPINDLGVTDESAYFPTP